MSKEFLIPSGFKDEVTFNAYVEHQYKNKIIDYFKLNGFDLVKTPLIEYKDKLNKNNFFIQNKKLEEELQIRNDITPQIIRVVSSRFTNRKMPIKLCYYGEVVRKSGSMLRPERQFLQVGAETIGSDKVEADIEIINIAYQCLSIIGIKNITIELSSRIFLDKIFNTIKNKKDILKIYKLITTKDLESSLALLDNKNRNFIKNIFSCTGSFNKIKHKLSLLNVDEKTRDEINRIRKIADKLKLKYGDKLYIDFSELNEKNYHNGIRFTFFAKNVRGEIASGGRYHINNNSIDETATGFTCYMDSIIRASSFANISKKILIPFNASDSIKNKLQKNGYTIFAIFEDFKPIKSKAKKYGCSYYLDNQKIKSA